MRSPDFIRERAKDMRRTLTQPERALWLLLRRNELGLHFRRQHPVGPYILDFYCAAQKLAVEVDGPAHDEQQARDDRRTAWLAAQGIRVIRFTAADIDARPAAVLPPKASASSASPPRTSTPVQPPSCRP